PVFFVSSPLSLSHLCFLCMSRSAPTSTLFPYTTLFRSTQPGWLFKLPFGVHSVTILDASPHTFTMRGETNIDAENVRELTVRASDGSNFHFQDTKIIFQIRGDEAQKVIADAGPGGGFVDWMRPYARAEIGRAHV